MRLSRLLLVAAVAVFPGCRCGPNISQQVAQLDVLDAQGNQRELVDFGNVQIDSTSTRQVRVRNGGSGSLSLTGITFSDAHFGCAEQCTFSIGPGEETLIGFTFTPDVADTPVQGTATLASNDGDSPSIELTLKGNGIVAAAVVQPTTLAFGDVYLGETKSLALTVTNAGSDELVVSGATVVGTTEVTGTFDALDGGIAPGASASVMVSYAPTARTLLDGSLKIAIPPSLGTLSVPLTGAGIAAAPKLCFRFDDTNQETCAESTGTGLNVAFGQLCDGRVYPEDGGLHCDFDGGTTPYSRSGTLYVRNDGNTPVSYSMNISRSSTAGRCDGGAQIDFVYGNQPVLADGGSPVTFMVPTVTTNGPDVAPAVTVVYRATSACRAGDDADLSFVTWTRQGEPGGTNRQPPLLTGSLTGSSLLSNPEPFGITFTGNQPAPQTVNLISNNGGGPLQVTAISLRYSADGGSTPNADCEGVMTPPCQYFAWLDGGAALPVTLEGARPFPVTRPLRNLAYGTWTVDITDAGFYVAPSAEQKVWAEVQTSDPYEPTVLVPIIGRLQ